MGLPCFCLRVEFPLQWGFQTPAYSSQAGDGNEVKWPGQKHALYE